jgi:hypothetical protein
MIYITNFDLHWRITLHQDLFLYVLDFFTATPLYPYSLITQLPSPQLLVRFILSYADRHSNYARKYDADRR